MKEYLFLFRGGSNRESELSPEELQNHMQKWVQWMGDLANQEKYIGAQPLEKSGKKVTGKNKVVTDGPFMEGKEMIGGYLMCKADTYDEASEIAKGCPILEFDDGGVEIREIRKM
ncbi:MAG: YciI family protein [Bacteroidota bacterium]|nr:YciI family protein [Bacteroidota bacterium]